MTLQKQNFQKLDTYESVMTLVNAIAAIIKNPPDVKQASAEALALIKEAKESHAKLDADRVQFKEETGAIVAQLNERKKEIDHQSIDIQNQRKNLQASQSQHKIELAEAGKRKNEIEVRDRATKDREEKSLQKDTELKALESRLQKYEVSLKDIERQLDGRDRALGEREQRIKQALG